MERFIHNENLAHYRRLIAASERDPSARSSSERTAARKHAAEYFQQFPQGPLSDRGRELAPSAIAKHRIHHEVAARADRGHRTMSAPRGWKRPFTACFILLSVEKTSDYH
jgi:hypothetical protein